MYCSGIVVITIVGTIVSNNSKRMSDAIDKDLIELINKLTKIQEQVGGSAKKASAAVGDDGKIDKFLELRNNMIEKVASLKDTLKKAHEMEKSSNSVNPKDLIMQQSKVRTDLAALNEDWKELDAIFKAEARKKRTKFSPEVMKLRQNMVIQLQTELHGIREVQRAGFVKGYVSQQRYVSMEESEAFQPSSTSAKGGGKDGKKNDFVDAMNSKDAQRKGRHNDMSDQQRTQMQQIKERDKKIDEEIDLVGRGVDELHILARAQNEEIKLQHQVLDKLGNKMDSVHENVLTVNDRLKKALEETRQGDKICCDIFCILFLVGMIIVLVKISEGNKK